MKTKTLIFVVLTIGLTACEITEPHSYSQDTYLSRSFNWVVNNSVEDGFSDVYSITVGKDTIINRKKYRLVDNYYPLRQTKDRIYLYDVKTKKEFLLYDFSLRVGETIEQREDPLVGLPARKAKVIKTETITLLDGRKARRIEYEQTYPGPRAADIEYVGSEKKGILGPLDNSVHERTLVALYDKDVLVYQN